MSNQFSARDFLRHYAEPHPVLQNAGSWHDNAANGDQHAVALHAPDDAEHPVSSVLQVSKMCRKIFRHAERVEHIQWHFPPPAAQVKGYHTTHVHYRTQNFRLISTIRFRAASCSDLGTSGVRSCAQPELVSVKLREIVA